MPAVTANTKTIHIMLFSYYTAYVIVRKNLTITVLLISHENILAGWLFFVSDYRNNIHWTYGIFG